ncbi:MAG: carotenoid biosynthesis protein [Candidatus Caldarchaeum sp.]
MRKQFIDAALILTAFSSVFLPPDIGQLHIVVGFSFTVICLVHVFTYLNRAVVYAAASFATGLVSELYGVNYGIPFGAKYQYIGAASTPMLFGAVPLNIPLLWLSLGYLALHLGRSFTCSFLWIPLSSLFLVFLDVMLDPVLNGRLWIWLTPGEFYGVPLLNFVGWFAVSALFYSVYHVLEGRPKSLSPAAIAAFVLIALNMAFANLVNGMWLATAVGLPPILIASAMALGRQVFRRKSDSTTAQ